MADNQKASPQPAVNTKEQFIPILLSFIAAFVDVVCYLGLFRTFTAFVTGTLIILAAETIYTDDVWITKAVVVLGFIISLFFWLVILRRFVNWRYLRAFALAAEAVLLAVFAITGSMLSPLNNADSPETILVALIAVLAMSLQNAAMAQIFHQHVPTTVMTGNFTRFAISAIDILGSGRTNVEHDEAAAYKTKGQLRHYCFVLIAFTIGALIGAFTFYSAGFLALACPTIILAALSLHQWHVLRQ